MKRNFKKRNDEIEREKYLDLFQNLRLIGLNHKI